MSDREAKRTRGAKLFTGWCALVVAAYALATWQGWGPAPEAQPVAGGASSIRQSPGGYRSPIYWRGGK